MTEVLKIGDWQFSPDTASLARGDVRRRLEHRAAMVLEVLCRRQGRPVSTAELVENVWNGRALSQNSVAVVIADLRRALDDDSRRPRYIETIPKRGYRLLLDPVESEAPEDDADTGPSPAPHSRRIALALAALLAILLAALAAATWLGGRTVPPFTVTLTAIPNETGNPAHDPLAIAVTDLVATETGGVPGVRVMRGSGVPVDARIGGRLVLWNGQVSLSLSAEDPRTGEVLWSAIAAGPAGELPRQVHGIAGNLGSYVAQRRARSR